MGKWVNELRCWVGRDRKQPEKVAGRGEGCKQKTPELSLILNSFDSFHSQNLSGLSLFSTALPSFICKSSFDPLISHGMTDVYISLVPSLPLSSDPV